MIDENHSQFVEEIDCITNDILNGRRDIPKFTQPEHAGVCSAGPLLIGALLVCYNARESITSSTNAGTGQATIPNNWQIDEEQERQLQKWAEAKHVWFPQSEKWLTSEYGPIIAMGAEAKVFYKTGDFSVVKLRTSIYAILERALEAIALHNYLFPETMMRVTGFTRDTDGLFRIILTQPYIECRRLATRTEIDKMVALKGFYNNGDTSGVNYISPRLHLEDMHPANVFIDALSGEPVCIDCIVKFVV